MTQELKCTEYSAYEYGEAGYTPCKCPVCGAFLKWNWENLKCTKCGTELLVIPERDEETGEEMEVGKICPISQRKQ